MENKMTIDVLAADFCTTALGWTEWDTNHEQLYKYIMENLVRFRDDIYDDSDTTTIL